MNTSKTARGDRPAVGCAVPFYRSDRPRSPCGAQAFRPRGAWAPRPEAQPARAPPQAGARRCAEPEEQSDAPQPVTAAFYAAAECDKNPVRAYGILYRKADAKEDGAHPLFGVRAVLWRKRGEKR